MDNIKHQTPKYIHPDHIQLIDTLKNCQYLRSNQVEKVMKSIDRGDFVEQDPYEDRPQYLGYSATISAPHMHAYCLELLEDHLKRSSRVLDVGSGSGYLTLAFAKMMPEGGVTYGIEHISELVRDSINNIKKNHSEYINNQKVIIQVGDGRLGLPEYAPFDCIHVGASSEQIPKALVDQLNFGGRMIIPVGSKGFQEIIIIEKSNDGKIKKYKTLAVQYVPLTSKDKQLKEEFYD